MGATSVTVRIVYCDSQYKKKIKLIVNPCRLLDTDKPNPEKLICKLDKRIERYFNNKYKRDDCSGDDTAFCYDGNSNGIKFLLYDLEALLDEWTSNVLVNWASA